MGLDQRDLLSFHIVAESGSFTKAADILSVSKGYISKSVNRLEQQLNNKLLMRTTRQLVLTDVGERLFETTNIMQDVLRQGLENLQKLTGKPKGVLKISAPPGFTEAVLAPIISKFIEKYPEVKINLNLESKLVDIISDKYDLVLRSSVLKDSSLIARKLLDIKNVLVASPLLFKKYNLPKTPEDLEQLPCIDHRSEGKIIWNFRQANKSKEVNIKPILISNLSSLLKECALNSTGIMQTPLFMVEKEIEQKQLQIVLPEWVLPKSPLYLVYPSRDYMPLKTRCFIDFLSASI